MKTVPILESKVGDVVKVNGVKYDVEDDSEDSCMGCAFEELTNCNSVLEGLEDYCTLNDLKFTPLQQESKVVEIDTQVKIRNTCDSIREMLLEKNRSYGDSALNPSRIFAKSDAIEQIKVRIDDKLNRIMKGEAYTGDNDVDDLIGYLVLLKIANSEE